MEDDLEKELEELMSSAIKERDSEEDNSNDSNDNDDNGGEDDNENNDNNNDDNISNDDDSNDADDLGDENLDDKNDSNDENSDDNNEDNSDDNSDDKFEPIEVELSNGVKISIDSKEELVAFAKKGASSKTEAPKRETQNEAILRQGNISKEDLTLLMDAKNGDANAIAKLAEIGKVDILDVEADHAGKYTPQFEASVQSDIEFAAGQIMKDEVHASEFTSAIKTTPEDFINEISSDVGKLNAFSGHVRSGLAQKIIPLAIKSQSLNGGDFYGHYAKIGRELSAVKAPEKKPSEQRQITDREKKMRDRANVGGNNSSKGNTGTSVEDIWNMSKEELAKIDISKLD